MVRCRLVLRGVVVILHCIADEGATAPDLLAAPAAAAGFHLEVLDLGSGPQPAGPGDAVYCDSSAPWACKLERRLVAAGMASIYADRQRGLSDLDTEVALTGADLPRPDEIVLMTWDRDALRAAVESVGGYPVTVRCERPFVGPGVIPVDSPEALFGLVDLALSWRQFPRLRRGDAWHCLRTVWVAGGEVVAAHERNTWIETAWPSPPAASDAVALRAAEAVGLRFAAVDLTFDPEGEPRVVDARVPRPLPPALGPTLAGALVDLLAQ